MKLLISILILFFIFGCSSKQLIKSESKVIIFKTKKFRFSDYGFINRYENYINLKILNAGVIVLDLDIYKDKICKKGSLIYCQNSAKFYKNYFGTIYKDDFLYDLFQQEKIYFKDKKHHILIKAN